MSIYATTTEIQSFFKAQWAIQGRAELIAYQGYENDAQRYAKGNTAWLRISRNESDARQKTMQSEAIYRATGQITIQCFQRAKTGTDIAEKMSDAVISIFRQFAINGVNSGLIRNIPGTSPNADIVGIDPGGWFQINVVIPYIRDTR